MRPGLPGSADPEVQGKQLTDRTGILSERELCIGICFIISNVPFERAIDSPGIAKVMAKAQC